MPSDRDKLLKIMDSLEVDYRSGKISPEKYRYFRSKYEDKLNSIDAKEATQKIRSMQGKSNQTTQMKRSRKPTKNKKEKEQDLVQKYIINPKRGDAKYNKKEKKSMSSGTFKLILLLVVAFTVGVGYGVFNLDFNNISETSTVAMVHDTAFPDITEDIKNTTKTTSSSNTNYSYTDYDVKTTEDSSSDSDYSGGDSGSSSNDYGSSGSDSGSGSGSSSHSGGSESNGRSDE